MYGTTSVIIFTGADAIIAKAFSGRSSNNFFRLQRYSSLLMPGVISPFFNNYNRDDSENGQVSSSKTNNDDSENDTRDCSGHLWMSACRWLSHIVYCPTRKSSRLHYLLNQQHINVILTKIYVKRSWINSTQEGKIFSKYIRSWNKYNIYFIANVILKTSFSYNAKDERSKR